MLTLSSFFILKFWDFSNFGIDVFYLEDHGNFKFDTIFHIFGSPFENNDNLEVMKKCQRTNENNKG